MAQCMLVIPQHTAAFGQTIAVQSGQSRPGVCRGEGQGGGQGWRGLARGSRYNFNRGAVRGVAMA